MIAHVVERARACPELDEVIVATDDERIADAAREAGATVAMTDEAATGSDRIAAVARQREDIDVVVNLQGDEPLITPDVLRQLVEPFRQWEQVQVTTVARVFAGDEDSTDPNRVKVVRNADGDALYFSRAPIPWSEASDGPQRLLHMGLYAYWRNALLRFAELPVSPLEKLERLEQLRLLENGIPVRVIKVNWCGLAVDTPEDVAAVEEELKAGIL